MILDQIITDNNKTVGFKGEETMGRRNGVDISLGA